MGVEDVLRLSEYVKRVLAQGVTCYGRRLGATVHGSC